METVVTFSPENTLTITLMALVGFMALTFIAAAMRREVRQ
jgi:hypothetical protein